MKLNCKRTDFTYTPGEEIFNFSEGSGLLFVFGVEEELTGDPTVTDAVGGMLDEAEKLAEKAKAAIKAALADEDSHYRNVATFFMKSHRDDIGPDIVAELFPGADLVKLSFAEVVDLLKLKRFGSLVDSEMNQQVFIPDLSFNPEITDELMVIYFDLNKEIFCITYESWARLTYTRKGVIPMKAFDPSYKLLDEMYQGDYYSVFLVDKIKDELQKVIALLESGETDTEVVQETLDEAVYGIDDLQEEFDENDSEIETVAWECIVATVAYIPEWFGIPTDTEETIRERDW